MKKNIHLLILLLIWLFPAIAKCQPGYQGKKTLVKYGAIVSPAWRNSNYNSKANFFSYNATHALSLTRVMTRRSMFGIKGSVARTSVPYSLLMNGTNLYQGDVSPIKSTAYSGGIEYYLFRKSAGNLAPLGSYFMVECNLLWITLSDKKYDQSIGGFNKLNAGIWFGQQKIYYNRILLDVAVGSQLLLITSGTSDILTSIVDSNTEYLTLKQRAESRWFQRNLINLKVGVGYLF